MNTLARYLACGFAALLASGCASLSEDGGAAGVDRIVGSRGGERIGAAALAERLSRPLSSADAVAIALANNPGLRASYADVRIAETEVVQATRLRNPGFSYGRFKQGDEREIERRITLDVIGLVTMPWRSDVEKRLYGAAQMRAAIEVARVADETRRAWVEAVAAGESARYAVQVKDAAEASAEIAAQMARAGNFSRLSQSREQVFYAEAVAQLARARMAATSARERLVRLLGLWGEQAASLELPERLPDVPGAPRDLRDAESIALTERLDVRAARTEVESLAGSLGLAKATRFVNVLELTYEHDSSNHAPKRTGYEIEFSLPIFDWGDARIARTEATYTRAFNRAAETAINARSQVRESYAAYRTAYDLARHYREEIVPLRKRISEENLLRYNGMLISVFELLADSREQVAAVIAAIDATRDFWVADANLQAALTTGSPGAAPAMRASLPATPSASPAH